MEYHPRINEKQDPLGTNKIILGSFPVWTLTSPDIEKNETFEDKERQRVLNKDYSYFYGSASNQFWDWYKRYIDDRVDRTNIFGIQKSLIKNGIGITDMIFSCSRKNKSALDKNLTSRKYNQSFFIYPHPNETLKIFCTSKGVLNEMLLNNSFFKIHTEVWLDEDLSMVAQSAFLEKLSVSQQKQIKPFFKILRTANGGKIECIATPSPGSPYRKLAEFGYVSGDNKLFLDTYLSLAFAWFNS